MDKKSQKYLLALARQTIVDYYKTGQKLSISKKKLPSAELAKNAATFVTLTENGGLRGCIGSLIPKKKMYEDVINNALYAAFGDSRFEPVAKDEISKIRIEISVLSEAFSYNHKSVQDLLKKIKPKEHGIIIQRGLNQATYLPQVWEDLPNKKEFLSSLCRKAGLSENDWQKKDCEILYYTVESFTE